MPALRRIATVLLAASITSFTAAAQPKPGELDEVIRQMDAASTKFKSAEADFRWDIYELVVKETTSQTGTIYYIKNGNKTEMGAKILPPGPKFLEFKDGKLRLYDPVSNHLTVVNAGKNKGQYESFLTIGFGGSGSELAKQWTIADGGPETLNDGQKQVVTRKLDLVSKDPNVRNMFTHITIWVDPVHDVSLKQQFFMPSGDYRTCIYTNIRYDQPVNTKPYEIKTDKKTTVEQH
jgi:outer membrane lipoprotein-sorting protein